MNNFGPDPEELTDDPVVNPSARNNLTTALTSTPSLQTTDATVDAINGMTDKSIDPEVIRTVLAALNAATTGPEAGTVLRDEATGQVAHRVLRGGVPMWSVSALDGGQWFDTQSTLPWGHLADPIAH